VGGRKSPFPITLAIGLYNSFYYRTSRDLMQVSHLISSPRAVTQSTYSLLSQTDVFLHHVFAIFLNSSSCTDQLQNFFQSIVALDTCETKTPLQLMQHIGLAHSTYIQLT